jgi:gamma-glutamyltranspeptidase/glutathione hydrolase
VAQALVKGVRKHGGIWQLKDLQQYQVVKRRPIVVNYRGYKVVSASPPSSGGIVLGEMLNILSGYDLKQLSPANRDHLIIEAMRRAYRDRAAYLGDPDFVKMPIERLLSPYYAAGLRVGIRMDKTTRSNALAPVARHVPQGNHTTHFSIIDRDGNRVGATMSINLPYGSGFMAPGTGVILNDEMDDFSAKPLTPNAYGLIGTEENAIAPGKRPLSSMTPTFVVGPKRTAVLGTPGGSRIITMVLLGALNFIDGGSATQMVSLRRFHNQYLPDRTLYEPGAFTAAEKAALKKKGDRLKQSSRLYGNMQVVIWDRKRNTLSAASDPRGIGAAKVAAGEH